MFSNSDYIKKILQHILDSYLIIQNLKDQTGDLDVIKKELLKINGFFNVFLRKLEKKDHHQSSDLIKLKLKITNFTNNYYFVQEIDTMSSLYSNDQDRIRSMRLKILEAFQDKRLIETMQEFMEKL